MGLTQTGLDLYWSGLLFLFLEFLVENPVSDSSLGDFDDLFVSYSFFEPGRFLSSLSWFGNFVY
jgi:hypothetical protein